MGVVPPYIVSHWKRSPLHWWSMGEVSSSYLWSMGEMPTYTGAHWERCPLTLVVNKWGALLHWCSREDCPHIQYTLPINYVFVDGRDAPLQCWLVVWIPCYIGGQWKRMSFLHTFTKTTGLSCSYLRDERLYATVTAKRCKWQDYARKFRQENKPPQLREPPSSRLRNRSALQNLGQEKLHLFFGGRGQGESVKSGTIYLYFIFMKKK